MIRILIKHIVTEIAITALFNKLNDNFIKPKLQNLLLSDNLFESYTKKLHDGIPIDGIEFFKKLRAMEEDPSGVARLDNIINILTETERTFNAFTQKEDSLVLYPNPRSNEKQIWKIDVDDNRTTTEHIIKLDGKISRRVNYDTKAGEVNY